MFQYRIQDKIIDNDTLKIYNGFVKATKEEIEITAIKRDCYKHNLQKVALEKYLKSKRDILTMIDIFPSKVFPTKTNGEWLVIVETKQYYNLTDFILNNIEIENNVRNNMDILSLIYELITVILTFSNYDKSDFHFFYQRLIPQNIFISEFNEIYLKFPYWLLINDDINKMNENELNFVRYYLPPHLLFNISTQDHNKFDYKFDNKLLCNIDIWCIGCCIAEIFYGLPLFSSIDISDQFLKMFQILGYPDWTKSPWKYWKISDKFKKSIEMQCKNNDNCLNKMINNEAIVDLLRSCLQYSSLKQISLHQLSIFIDMFEINDKTENQQNRLTFNDIQSWHNDISSKSNKNQDIVIIGCSTFINEWSLKSPKKIKNITNNNNNQKQKGIQTKKIKTTDNGTNTENISLQRQDSVESIVRNKRIEKEIKNIENDLNITDCINILPYSKKYSFVDQCKKECNLLIIEFSNICNLDTLTMESTKSFSFQCKMNNKQSIFSSPIFNIDNLRQTNNKRQKVYIHIMLKDKECKDILDDNQCINIQIISHYEYDKSQQEIGEINIDISMLKQYKIIEGYYHIFPTSNTNNDNNNNSNTKRKHRHKLGQVYIRVLPQFNVLKSDISQKENECNESVMTDDHSIISNEAWSMFNKFVQQSDQI